MKKNILIFGTFLLLLVIGVDDSKADSSFNGTLASDMSFTGNATGLTFSVAGDTDHITNIMIGYTGPEGTTAFTDYINITNGSASQDLFTFDFNTTALAIKDGYYDINITTFTNTSSTEVKIDSDVLTNIIVNNTAMTVDWLDTSPADGSSIDLIDTDTTWYAYTSEDATSVILYFDLNAYELTPNSSLTGWSREFKDSEIAEKIYTEVKLVATGLGSDDLSTTAFRTYTIDHHRGGGGSASAAIITTLAGDKLTTSSALGDKVKTETKKELEKKELVKTGSGAIVGGIIGTFVFPGVGTAIGAFIGGVAGVLF